MLDHDDPGHDPETRQLLESLARGGADPAALLRVSPDRVVGEVAEILAALLYLDQRPAVFCPARLVSELRKERREFVVCVDVAVDVRGFCHREPPFLQGWLTRYFVQVRSESAIMR